MHARTRRLALLALVSLAACRGSEGVEAPPSAFIDEGPTAFREVEPPGPARTLVLSRPSFSDGQLAELTRSISGVVAGAGSAPLEVDYRPERPSILVGLVNRDKPSFSTPGTYPGIGRGEALERARRCADELAAREVIPARSYLAEPILERAPSSRYPAGADGSEAVEVTDHYHFVFGRIQSGVLLGNSELSVDVDTHSGDCFRVEVAFVDEAPGARVDLIVAAAEAKAAVEADAPEGGGVKVVDEGRILYWLDPGVASAVVEPRYVSSYSLLSPDGLATQAVTFAVTLSEDPPVIHEY